MLSTTSKRKRDGKDHGEGARRGARKKFKTSSLDKSKAHKYNRMESMHDGLIETALASTNQVQKKNMTEKDVSKARGLARFEAKQRRREKKLAKERPSEEDTWSVSHAIGGSLLSLEPVFSADEKHLLLAYQSCVQVYTAPTSLLLRTIDLDKAGSITGLAISPINPSQFHVAFSSGIMEKWDWVSGVKQGAWDIASRISGLQVAASGVPESMSEIVYTVDSKSEKWSITAHRLGQGTNTELKTLFKPNRPVSNLRVLAGGLFVVASSEERLILGSLQKTASTALKDVVYEWREVKCLEFITCLDARISNAEPASSGVPASPSSLDIAVGGITGAVFVYRDHFGQLKHREHGKGAVDITPSRYHWHRTSVGAVKWSIDGNYVISGGAENVLVLWQLDTSAKQFLPHLSAAIENIAVAPSGSSYAVHNSNNSVTVISTLDFQPTFHVSGIQLPVRKDLAIPDVARVTTKNGLDPISRRPPITTSLSQPGCLLVAVPAISTSPTDGASCASAVYLQTYDIRSGSSVSKQALTRTKLTDRTTGPEGNVIQEPDVVLLRTSHDGKWLATADEWAPPTRDYKPTSVDEAATTSAVQSRIEVYLKFWLWNDGPKIWELATRIDMPHPPDARNSGSLGRILDLVEEPSRLGFITLGDDATVRVWKPRARSRNGDEIRRKAGQPSVNWSCRVVAPLPSLDFGSSRIKAQGITRIAVSEDGSLTVVGQHSPVGSVIHLVDTLSGEIRSSISGLFTGSLSGLGIIDQFLIVLSDELIVWDMVHGRIRYGLPLKPQAERNWKASDGTRRSLAFNWKEKTFAVSTPELSNNKSKPSKMGSQVTVFNPTTPTPIFSTRLPQKLKALLPSNDDKGYVTISSTVEVRRLLPRHQLPLMDASPAGEELPALAGLENIYGHGKALPASNETANHQTLATNIPKETPISITAADDKIVVRQHQLADIFGIGQPFALPPVTDLFERVAGLFSRKITPAA